MSLLPPNTTKLERALESALLKFDHPKIVPTLWNADDCPAETLPWLAWALSVDDWEADWPIAKKRAAVAESIEIHEHKGTPSAIKRALGVRGHGDADLIERSDSIRYDGQATYNGNNTYGGAEKWATFSVVLKRPVTLDQAESITRMFDSVKRNCCHLVRLDYVQAALRYNGEKHYDGQYTYGTVTI